MWLNIIINLILVLMILGGLYLGYRRGFISIAAKPVKIFAAIAITFACCTSVGHSLVKPIIDAPITEYVSGYLNEKCAGLNEANVSSELPTVLKMAAGMAGINIEKVAGDAAGNGEEIIDTLADTLSDPVVNMLSVAIAFVAIYIVAKILLSLLFKFINHSLKGGVLGWINKVIGMLVGLCLSIIASWCLVSVLEFIFHSPACASNPELAQFEGAFLYHFFKTYNPVELLLSF